MFLCVLICTISILNKYLTDDYQLVANSGRRSLRSIGWRRHMHHTCSTNTQRSHTALEHFASVSRTV